MWKSSFKPCWIYEDHVLYKHQMLFEQQKDGLKLNQTFPNELVNVDFPRSHYYCWWCAIAGGDDVQADQSLKPKDE